MSRRRYRITHQTTYTYSDLVNASYGRGYLRPRETPWQQLLDHELTLEPVASDAQSSLDVYGNTDSFFHVTQGHTELVVRSSARVPATGCLTRDGITTWSTASSP